MGSFMEGSKWMPFGKDHVHRCMGMWLSNGLHHLWCETGPCYVAREECTCKLCGCAGVGKCHLLTCEWACSILFNRVRKIARVTRADRRRMVELREETGVQRSLTGRLVRSRLQWAGHVESK